MATRPLSIPRPRRAIARVEDGPLLRGEGRFAADLRLPGMLHAAVIRSPFSYGALREVDLGPARACAGVVDAFSAADLDWGLPRIPSRLPLPPGVDAYLQPVLAASQVRYVGQPLALVVATSPAQARDAAEAAVLDLAPDTPPPPEAIVSDESFHGDTEAAFAGAATVVRGHFAVARQAALPLETRGLIADFDADAGALTLWAAAKAPNHVRTSVASALGLPAEAVRVRPLDTGGGFGVRGELHPEDVLVALASLRNGRPVSWVEERLEHLQSAYQSRDQRWEAALALASDGTILGLEGAASIDVGAFVGPNGLTPGRVALRAFAGPYRVPAYHARAVYERSCKPPLGTMRGPGYVESTFVRERLMDLAAARLGLDPAELRRRNLVSAGEMPYATGIEGVVYDGGDYSGPLEAVLERLGAGAGEAAPAGLGVSCVVEASGTPGTERASARLEPDGTVVITLGAFSFGQGHLTGFAQVAGRVLGQPVERIRVSEGDTGSHPYDGGTFASRSAVMAGSACQLAAAELRTEILARAASLLGGEAALREGRVERCDEPALSLTLAELAPLEVEASFSAEAPTFTYGACAARVELDAETGTVRVVDLAVAADAGRAINPELARGQLAGGAVQGLGGALFEQLDYDEECLPRTGGLRDYHLPLAADVPPIHALVLELVPSPRNPLGVRGVGEIATAAAAAAIANAVAAAVPGKQLPVNRLPISPEQLRRA